MPSQYNLPMMNMPDARPARRRRSVEDPLHVILRHRFFDAFASGEKTREWRRHNERWNAQTCRPGRRVVLMRGYSHAGSLDGTITAFEILPAPDGSTYQAGTACAVFTIELDSPRP